MTIQIKQSSSYDGKDWWTWAVWLEAPKAEMDAIKWVVYTLHSTFPDPVRTVKTRRNGFKIESSGWGEFKIYLEIVRSKGASLKRTHQLSLEYPAKDKRAPPRSAPAKSLASAPSKPAAPGAPDTPGNLRPAAPRVYVSSGSADSDFARRLKEQLSGHGVTITSIDDLALDAPWEVATKRAIESSDATVFVVSGEPSLWSNLEMGYARGLHKASIPVLVGSKARLPTALASSEAVHVDSPQDVNEAMEQILSATRAIKV